MKVTANTAMAEAWDGDEGDDWARDWRHYDRSVAAYHPLLLDAAAVEEADAVLDIGCGAGQVTRDAARRAPAGSALGVDLSRRMLEVARAQAEAEGVANARFEQADAQVHPFEPAAFDTAVSRFGAMFFADADAAFANVARALRPGGRLAMVAWRTLDENEWLVELRAALALGRDLPAPPAGAPGPFGQADPDRVRAVLAGAGFAAVGLEALDLPFWLGGDADDAFAFFSASGVVRGLLHGVDDAGRAVAFDRLRDVMRAHETPDGVLFRSAGWLITARRG